MHWISIVPSRTDNHKDMNMTAKTLSDFTHLAVPEKAIMKAAEQLIHAHIASLTLDFLPAIKIKLPSVQAALTAAGAVLSETLTTVTVQLNNEQLNALEIMQREIEADLTLSLENKQKALGLLDTQRVHAQSSLQRIVSSSANAIAQRCDDLKQINIKPDATTLKDTLQRQLDSLNQQNAKLASSMASIAEDRRLLDSTIATLEKYNLADQFKDILPTADELALINMPSPELALVQAGLARLEKMLGQVSNALKYLDLVNERDTLRHRYNALLAQSRGVSSEAKALARNLAELQGLDSIDQNKGAWINEAAKVYEALYGFLAACQSPDAISGDFTHYLAEFKTYLKQVHDIKRTL
ncbi:alpha-xenorhabdolysin family binary toxin subunit B [Pseudomonas syringae]|nr:alpha-xenorhabdolysin family binary toxin subunit B [Pseudomonas syringae]